MGKILNLVVHKTDQFIKTCLSQFKNFCHTAAGWLHTIFKGMWFNKDTNLYYIFKLCINNSIYHKFIRVHHLIKYRLIRYNFKTVPIKLILLIAQTRRVKTLLVGCQDLFLLILLIFLQYSYCHRCRCDGGRPERAPAFQACEPYSWLWILL